MTEKTASTAYARVVECLRTRGNRLPTHVFHEAGSGFNIERYKRAAVLMPLCDVGGRLHAVYILRTRTVRDNGMEAVHSGQIGFPGGRIEKGESPLEAAVREAQEEIALPPDRVEVLAKFGTFSTIASYFIAEAFLGWIHGTPRLVPNESEVERIFIVPLDELLPQHNRQLSLLRREDILRLHYHWTEPKSGQTICIWGMTGRITWVLLEFLFF